MFEATIKRVIKRYNEKYWFIKEHPIEQQKIELINAVKEDIDVPSAYVLIQNAIDYPNAYEGLYNYLDNFPLLDKCLKFIRQEGISLNLFNNLLEEENSDKFNQEAKRLLDSLLAKEMEPYFTLIFETIPTREKRANALFKED